MAHTYDTKANLARGRSSQGRDLSYTCGSGATLLVLGIVVGGLTARTGGAPTYNGVALTQAGTNAQASGGETTVELWYLLNPPTESAYTIHIPDDNNVYFTAEASSYKAASGYTSDLRTADIASGTSTNPTGPTHTGLASGDVIVAAIGSGATTWNPSDRTGVQLYDVDDGSYGDGGQYLIKTDANDTAMAWTFGTSDDWAIVSAVFKEAQLTTGALAGTLAAVTGSVAGAHGVAGSATGTLTSVSGNATGVVRAEGSLDGTLGNVTGSVAGAHGIAGSMAGTLAAATGVFSGAHGVAGSATGTLADLIGAMQGTVQESGVTGTLTGVLSNLVGAATGAHGVAGTVAGVLPNLIGNATGTISEPPIKWKFPHTFSDSGFNYGTGDFAYDPGAAAAIATGCLHIYMKTGDERAGKWARRILDDLRVNRQSTEYDYLYKTDSFHGWMQAMVAHAFGLAVTGRPGQAYAFPSIGDDLTHFENMIGQFFAMAGDSKPNVLNTDRIPFSFVDSRDSWEFAPNYIMDKEMGSMEALVLMMEAALDYGKLHGDWDWFNRLLYFVVRDNLVVLNQAQIHAITAACDQAGAANLVRLRYADYDRDSSQYVEARDQADLENNGEQAREVDCRYGAPVIIEGAETARLLATRLLQRLAPPLESAEVETWLEGVRIELGDTVAVTADFYGWDREEFTVQGKDLDLGHRRVRLNLSRPLDRADFWAVDVAGSANDAWAIDRASSWDEYWDSRAYVY